MGVLKAATLNKLAATFPRSTTAIVDGWAATNPSQVKAWEADGTLMQKVQEANEQAMQGQQSYEADRTRDPGMPALSSAEINELYGGPDSRL